MSFSENLKKNVKEKDKKEESPLKWLERPPLKWELQTKKQSKKLDGTVELSSLRSPNANNMHYERVYGRYSELKKDLLERCVFGL